jgi:hypothetical protein
MAQSIRAYLVRNDENIGTITSPGCKHKPNYASAGRQFIYDYETMKAALETTGFSESTAANLGLKKAKLLLDTRARSKALYVEVRKIIPAHPCRQQNANSMVCGGTRMKQGWLGSRARPKWERPWRPPAAADVRGSLAHRGSRIPS